MAKKSALKKREIRHARVELPPEDYAIVEQVARSLGLAVAAYMRMVVLQRARQDFVEIREGTKE